jgi:hypothetical protein
MSQPCAYPTSSEDYQTKKMGFGIRVVNLKKDIVEGIWRTDTKEWFDVQEFINQ